jgi:uncharacterized iron-regulated protein
MKTIILLGTIAIFFMMALPAMATDVILPHRVIDSKTSQVMDFEGLLAQCAQARVVILGENHDDPNTHLAELAMLQGLFRQKGDVILSMEMFERDTQEVLSKYVAGEVTESDLMAWGHPWPNYETDYKPLIEFAKEHKLAVVAANIPRPLAKRVSSEGYANTVFSDEEKPWVAESFDAPHDAYWDSWKALMTMPQMMGMGGMTEETIELFYQAQVIKDETMAESIARASEKSPDATVFHVTGAGHVADYLGTYPRVLRRLPGIDEISIIIIPVDDLLAPVPDDVSKADYYILVQAPPPVDESTMPPMPPMPPMPMPPASGTMPPKQ